MKKLLTKQNKYILIITFILLFLVHLPLITKNILSADILLNNYYYKGYSWELSLGRFSLYLIGLIKSYLNIPHIDLIICYTIISISTILLINLFNIKDKLKIILIILIITLSPVTSSTLTFNYCSIGYTLSLLFSILSVYIYYKSSNKYIKYILPITLIVISLSLYQAYLSVIITLFILYNIKLIIDKNINYKESLKYIILTILSIIIYYILIKLSQSLFNINMSTYSNANKIGFNLIKDIPNKIISSYKLFYSFYFTNSIVKNTYLHNNIINLILLIILLIEILYNSKQLNIKNKLVIYSLLLTIPIYLNSIIFVINDSKLQLLMSYSYLLIYIILIYYLPTNKLKYIPIFIIVLLLRNNLVQVESSYLTLEKTFNRYDTLIKSTIYNNINNNYKYVIVGKEKKHIDEINKLNYGFISDDSLFWEEYNLRRLGLERFTNTYLGINIDYVDEEEYNKLKDKTYNNLITIKDNIVIINLSKLN